MGDGAYRYVEESHAQTVHCFVEESAGTFRAWYFLMGAQGTGELVCDGGGSEAEAFQHEGNDLALGFEGGFHLAPEPGAGFAPTLKRRPSEDDEKVGAGDDVSDDRAFKVPAGDVAVVEEGVVSVIDEILRDRLCPGKIDTTVADEDGFLDPLHIRAFLGRVMD
jgi:hypothetical protein